MHIGAGPRSVNKNDDIYDHGNQKNSHNQPAPDAYRRLPPAVSSGVKPQGCHVVRASLPVNAVSGWTAEHSQPRHNRLAFVEGKALGFILQPRQRVPYVAPGIKRTQPDQA